jgi:hypothetical protein
LVRHNYCVITPQDPASEPANDAAKTDAAKTDASGQTHEVLVVHAPRYVRFIILGGIVGLLATLILTVSFPEQPGFSTAQVFGFLGLALVTVGVALGAAVAIVIDRMATRRARTGVMEVVERVQAQAQAQADADAAASDAITDSDAGAEPVTEEQLAEEQPAATPLEKDESR